MRVKCLAQEHNTNDSHRARTRTFQFGVQRANHQATVSPIRAVFNTFLLFSYTLQTIFRQKQNKTNKNHSNYHTVENHYLDFSPRPRHGLLSMYHYNFTLDITNSWFLTPLFLLATRRFRITGLHCMFMCNSNKNFTSLTTWVVKISKSVPRNFLDDRSEDLFICSCRRS